MTNENIIKQLKRLILSLQYADDVNAVKGAIQALSQVAICPGYKINCEDCPAYEPCDDAISREAVCKMICAEFVDPQDGMQEWRNAVNDVVENILHKAEKLPSVTQKSKTGHWKQISPAKIYECSECGKNVMTDDICAYGFCHGCGAKMVEPQESEDKEC